MQLQKPIRVFCSYSHKDRKYAERLHTALSAWVHMGDMRIWWDREIRPGMDWCQEIHDNCQTADLFVLLVSADFIDSHYCVGIELQIASEKYDKGEVAIVPVVVRDCVWKIPELARFQALPDQEMAIKRKGNDPDTAWKQVSEGIKRTIDGLCSGISVSTKRPAPTERIPELLPFLCDRITQEAHFRAALQAAPRDRPFLCILSGDDRQCHREFIDRLETSAIPEILGLRSDHAIYHPEPDLSWSRIHTAADIGIELAAAVDPQPASANQEDIATSIAKHPGLTVIRSVLTARHWTSSGPELLSAFVTFWDRWRFKTNQPVIVFLVVKYLEPYIRSANPAIAGQIERIPESPSLAKVALTSVPAADVERWLDDTQMRQRFHGDRIAHDLASAYQNDDALSMEDLAEELHRLLLRHRIQL